ncbi:MAG: ABC transporter ATP-binding protein [Bacteroidales bacterium]|nr:ABC transporter ATP-binding protein [Bacteroidales bacterium]
MIEVKNISYSYPISLWRKKQSPRVFNKFFLTLEEGKIYGLLGKNGVGKSTLLYLLAGLNWGNKGSIFVDGEDIEKREPSTLGKIFLVTEEFELPNMSLQKYVKLNRPFYPDFSDEILEKCLNDFEIKDIDNLSALSMGTKKKVYMSFALATNTKYLFLDEPTNGLDIESKSLFRKVIAQNMSDNRTIVISTHQVHDVEQLIDHILILGNDDGTDNKLLINKSIAELSDEYVFELRNPDEMGNVIYSENSLQGTSVIARRTPRGTETPINLELLYNAVNNRKL